MSWQDVLKGNVTLWFKGGQSFPKYTKIDTYTNNTTAFNHVKEIAARGNPAPWTVEGDEHGGRLVVYDGISMVLSAPSYDYQIIPEGEEPNLSYNPVQEHEVYSPRRTLDRLEGKEFEDHGEEFRERNI